MCFLQLCTMTSLCEIVLNSLRSQVHPLSFHTSTLVSSPRFRLPLTFFKMRRGYTRASSAGGEEQTPLFKLTFSYIRKSESVHEGLGDHFSAFSGSRRGGCRSRGEDRLFQLRISQNVSHSWHRPNRFKFHENGKVNNNTMERPQYNLSPMHNTTVM